MNDEPVAAGVPAGRSEEAGVPPGRMSENDEYPDDLPPDDSLADLVALVDAEVAVAAGGPAGRSGDAGPRPGRSDGETPEAAETTAGTGPGQTSAGRDAGRYDAGRYVLFAQGRARYAVPITQVLEVSSVPALTPVPHTPAWLLGVTNLRGEILSVLDLGTFLGGERVATAASRMLVVRGDNDEPYTGLVVDAVLGQTSVVAAQARQPAAPIEDPVMRYLDGVVEARGQAVGLLDLKRLVAAVELADE